MTKARHFKSRFIQPGLAGYPGQYGNALIKKENLDRFVHTLRNKPVTINHKDDIQDDDKVGEVFNVWFNAEDGWYWCDGIITDVTAQNLIQDKGWSVSCSYDYTKADNSGGTANNIPYDIEFLDGEFTHLAIVDNPRYEGANIVFNAKNNSDDRWITVHPHGDDGKGRPLLVKAGETNEQAIERKYGKEDSSKQSDTKDNKVNASAFRKESRNVSHKEADALYNYFSAENVNINNMLRGKKDDGWSEGYQKRLDNIVANIDSSMKQVPDGLKLYRRIERKDLEKKLGVAKLTQDVIGKSIEQKGYTSTTDSHQSTIFSIYGDDDKYITMEVNPIGLKGISLVDAIVPDEYDEDDVEYKDIANEREILLQRNTLLTIEDVVSRGNDIVVRCRLENSKGEDNMILNALKNLIKHVENAKDGDDNGRWITIKGTHVFIPDGKSVDEVMKETFGEKGEQLTSQQIAHRKGGLLSKIDRAQRVGLKDKEKKLRDRYDKLRSQEAEIKKEAEALKGKYAEEDADFDIDQLKKDIATVQRYGYEEVEDIAEFLGLDEDEVRETLSTQDDGSDIDDELVTVQKADTHQLEVRLNDLKSRYNEVMKYYWEADEGDRDIHQYKADAIQDEMIRIRDRLDEAKKNEQPAIDKKKNKGKSKTRWVKVGRTYMPIDPDEFTEDYMADSESAVDKKGSNKANNSKEIDMTVLEELKKLITRVENDKGENMEDDKKKEVDNEKVDKRKLIDEVGGILKGKVDDELIRTIIGKMEKMSYDESEAGTADNEKEKEEDEEVKNKKVKNEDEEDKKEADDLEKDEKDDVENKCVKNAKNSFFDKMNEIYNSSVTAPKEEQYTSRAEREQAAIDYFSK